MRQRTIIYILFFCAFAAHAAFSIYYRGVQGAWANVPPVPSEEGATALALGDEQLAYRMIGTMIQNLGDSGGRSMPLSEYDYDRLVQWFYLEDKLDRQSNYIPLLAAFYFSATQNKQDLDPVIEYLAMIGQRPGYQKWRWLAQAVYLARFGQGDLDKATELAYILASLNYEGMPTWTRQMPAFIAAAAGDKETALAIMTGILQTEKDRLHPNEVNFMVHYICERLLDKDEAEQYPLCN